MDPDQLKSYDKYDTKIHKNNIDKDMEEQKRKLENIYKHNDYDYKNVMKGMLQQNHNIMNQHWQQRNQQKENIKVMGIDSKHQVNK